MTAILRALLTSLAVARARSSAQRFLSYISLLAIAAFVALGATGFFLSALWIYLAGALDPMLASILIGGGLLVLSGIVLVIALVRHSARRATNRHWPCRQLFRLRGLRGAMPTGVC